MFKIIIFNCILINNFNYFFNKLKNVLYNNINKNLFKKYNFELIYCYDKQKNIEIISIYKNIDLYSFLTKIYIKQQKELKNIHNDKILNKKIWFIKNIIINDNIL